MLKRQCNRVTGENHFSYGHSGVFDFSASSSSAVSECSDEVARHILVTFDLMAMPRRLENGGILKKVDSMVGKVTKSGGFLKSLFDCVHRFTYLEVFLKVKFTGT